MRDCFDNVPKHIRTAVHLCPAGKQHRQPGRIPLQRNWPELIRIVKIGNEMPFLRSDGPERANKPDCIGVYTDAVRWSGKGCFDPFPEQTGSIADAGIVGMIKPDPV